MTFWLLVIMVLANFVLFVAIIEGMIALIVASIFTIVVCFALQNRYLKNRSK